MKKEIPNIYPDQTCFFCGSKNPVGLKLRFYSDDETGEVVAEFTAPRAFVGLGRILHGGIQSGLFDEIMGWTAHHLTGEMGVTSDLEITFVSPVYVGRKLDISCRLVSRQGSDIHLAAKIEVSGKVCSEAVGTYHLVSEDRFQRIIRGEE